jgi:3'-phosphoadenosine 5'-phosphosulfate sulfotransferase (PAPS reductase)/FAD synthetase
MTRTSHAERRTDRRTVVPDVDLSGRHWLLDLTADAVGRLSPTHREQRVELLIAESRTLLERGRSDLVTQDGKDLAGICVLFSGGNDSTVLAHLFRRDIAAAIHVNTGIGVEATRTFVRDTCQAWAVPLIEKSPPPGSTYRELVLDRGFPGPGQHGKMFQRLKERGLRSARADLISNSRRQRIVFLAGRRREESRRRANIPILERQSTIVYVSAIALWTKLDLNTYRSMIGDVPRNPVAESLHMSGECLCGSFAKPGELDEIGWWYPEVRAHIHDLEREAQAVARTGRFPIERACWGWGAAAAQPLNPSRSGVLCSSCDARHQLPSAA